MLLDQYTPDTICRSMDLSGFIEPTWRLPALRLLLMPSFDPEVCITVTGPAEASHLSVVALAEMLWLQPVPCALATWHERPAISTTDFAQCLDGFTAAFSASNCPGDRLVCLDGMPVACCAVSTSGVQQFADHPYRPAVAAFVRGLICLAWKSCAAAGVRNALAACARYVGKELPCDPQPPKPEVIRLLILGTSEERADYFQLLRERGGRRNDAPE